MENTTTTVRALCTRLYYVIVTVKVSSRGKQKSEQFRGVTTVASWEGRADRNIQRGEEERDAWWSLSNKCQLDRRVRVRERKMPEFFFSLFFIFTDIKVHRRRESIAWRIILRIACVCLPHRRRLVPQAFAKSFEVNPKTDFSLHRAQGIFIW